MMTVLPIEAQKLISENISTYAERVKPVGSISIHSLNIEYKKVKNRGIIRYKAITIMAAIEPVFFLLFIILSASFDLICELSCYHK